MMANPTINKLASYIQQKTGLLNDRSCDSGYSSVINDDSLMERKLSDPIEEEVDIRQLIYQVKRHEFEERPKFRLTFIVKRSDTSIFFKFGNKRAELTFNSLSNKIAEFKPLKIELSFKMSNEMNDFNALNVSKLFLRLGNSFINANQMIEIYVRHSENLITGMSMSFLKSLCAEHPLTLRFNFHEKLSLMSEIKNDNSVKLSDFWLITGGTSGKHL